MAVKSCHQKVEMHLPPTGRATPLERWSQPTVLSCMHSVDLTDSHCSDFLVLKLCLDYKLVSHGEFLTTGGKYTGFLVLVTVKLNNLTLYVVICIIICYPHNVTKLSRTHFDHVLTSTTDHILCYFLNVILVIHSSILYWLNQVHL